MNATETMVARVQLYQEGGVSGPKAVIPYESSADVIAWAEAQSGHPWDGVLVCVYPSREAADSGTGKDIETYELSCLDGA